MRESLGNNASVSKKYPAHYQILVAEDGEEREAAGWTVIESLLLYSLCTNALSWYRVQGVFVEKAMFL